MFCMRPTVVGTLDLEIVPSRAHRRRTSSHWRIEEFNMIPEPASAIKREVLQLIDLQVATLRQESSLDSSQLQKIYGLAKETPEALRELDQIGRPGQGRSLRLP